MVHAQRLLPLEELLSVEAGKASVSAAPSRAGGASTRPVCAAPLHETLQSLGISLFPADVVQSMPEPLQLVYQKQTIMVPGGLPEPAEPAELPQQNVIAPGELPEPAEPSQPFMAPGELPEPAEPPQIQLSEAIWRKACYVKQAYLFYTSVTRLSPAQLEQSTIDDLINAPLIAAGIAQANRAGASPPLQAEILLPTIFKEFRRDRCVNYEQMVQDGYLTDEDIKNVLYVLLSRKLFEEYLFWEQAQQLDDWLVEQRGGPTRARHYLLKVCPWIIKLSWWKEEVSYANHE